MNPSKLHKFPFSPFLCFLFVFIANTPTTTSESLVRHQNSNTETLYTQHCNDVVPQYPLASKTSSLYSSIDTSKFLQLSTGFFSGGNPIFNRTAADTVRTLSFIPYGSQKTVSDGVYKVQASLSLRNRVVLSLFGSPNHRRLRQIRFRGPRRSSWQALAPFSLTGYWSESSGKLCMVGSGSSYVDPGNVRRFNVILKLNYRINSSIYGSLISGTLESMHDDKDNSNYFEPISILGLNKDPNYEYTLVEKANGSDCLSGYGGGDSLSLSKWFVSGGCAVLGGHTGSYELEYGSDCGSVNCNPLGGSIGYLPNSMYYQGTRCKQRGKVQMLLGFPNSSYRGSEFPFDPNVTLIAEGEWDEKENRLCGVACRILNVTESWANAFVGDCSIRLTLRFPALFTLRNRSEVVGEIWSKKDVNDSGYFGKIGFQSYWASSIDIQSLKYQYTEIDTMRKSCAKGKTVKGKGKTYPDGYSLDMRFDMSLTDSKGKVAKGFSSPLFVGDQLYAQWDYRRPLVLPVPRLAEPVKSQLNNSHSSVVNISYRMSVTTHLISTPVVILHPK
ncbi:hypothetical protein SLA2020_407170 [Shorea laevis]